MAKLPSYLPMRVSFLDLSEQYSALSEPICEAMDEVLANHRFILGPKVSGNFTHKAQRYVVDAIADFYGSQLANQAKGT
jgi:hypothetical protein